MSFRLPMEWFVDGCPEPAFAKDLEGRYVRVNEAYARLLSLTRAEIERRTDADILDPGSAAQRGEVEKKAASLRFPITTDERHAVKDRVLSLKRTCFPLLDGAGEAVGTLSLVREEGSIHDPGREAANHETLEYLRNILHYSGDMIITTDQGRRIVSFNRGGELMLGYTREEMLGVDVEKLYVDPEERWALMRHVQDMGSVSNYETQLIRKDGHVVDISLTLSQLRDGQGRVIGTVGISKDITEQKAVEEKLRLQRVELQETRDYLHSILENTGDMIITTDLDRRIVSFNRGGELMLGYTREELLGQSIETLYPTEAERRALLKRVMAEGSVSNYETQLIHKDGRLVDISLTLSQLKDNQGRVIGTVGISKDITEQKALQRKLVESERLAAMGQTAAGLAHYIKNVINGLKGASFMLNTGLKRDRRDLIEEGWETVEVNISRVSALAMDMLHLSKEREPEYGPTDVNDLIREIARLMGETAAGRGVRLDLDLSAEIELLWLDAQGMHRSILNLVTNAVEAFDEVTAENKERSVILRTVREGGELVVEVRDTATGIRPDVQSRLFTQFFSTKAGMGTGLGLAVTRKTIEEHGGRIQVDSVWGRGTSFFIRLPYQAVAG